MDELAANIKKLNDELTKRENIRDVLYSTNIYLSCFKEAVDTARTVTRQYNEATVESIDKTTEAVNSLNTFIETLSIVNSKLTDFVGFMDKQKSAGGDTAAVDASATDAALNTIANGIAGAVSDAVPSAEVTQSSAPIDNAISTTVAPVPPEVTAPAPAATMENAPSIDKAITKPIIELVPPIEKQSGTVDEIKKLLVDHFKAENSKVDKDKLNALLHKDDKKEPTEKDFKNAKQNLMVDSVALGKEIAGGIKGTLGALLNPVALVAAFIVKFAPYIFLAICFLYGMWTQFSDELKTKIKVWGAILATGVIGSFIAFKGVIPMLIRGVLMGIKVYTLITRMQEHKAIMALYAKMATEQTVKHSAEMTNAATERVEDSVEHSMNVSNSIFERLCTWISTTFRKVAAFFDMICSRIVAALKALWTAITGAFDMACNVAKVAMAAIAIAIVIGLVILLVAGIFIIMILLSAAINKAVADIIVQFTRIGKEIKEMVNSIIDPITEVLNGLMHEMRQLFFDVKYGNKEMLQNNGSGNIKGQQKDKEAKQKQGIIQGELVVKDSVTKDDFFSVVTAITTPLNIMVVELGTMIALETAQLMMSNPFGALIALGTGAVGAGMMMSRVNNTTQATDNSESNVQRNETTNNTQTAAEPYDGFKEDFKKLSSNLNTLIQKLTPSTTYNLSPSIKK